MQLLGSAFAFSSMHQLANHVYFNCDGTTVKPAKRDRICTRRIHPLKKKGLVLGPVSTSSALFNSPRQGRILLQFS